MDETKCRGCKKKASGIMAFNFHIDCYHKAKKELEINNYMMSKGHRGRNIINNK